MRYFIAAISIFLLLACTKNKEAESPVSSANQANIKKWFNCVENSKQFQPDSLAAISGKMEKAAANESNEYKAMAAIAKGIFYSNGASYELAIKKYEQALYFLKKSQADTLKAFADTGIGNSYKNTGDYPKALGNLYKALGIFENRNHPVGISMVNSIIAEVHVQKADFKSAKENLKIALKTLENDKGKPGYLNAAHSLANVYGMSGDFKSALEIDAAGIRISDSIHSLREKVTFLDNKANCFLFSNQLDSAQYYFEECLKLDLAIGNKKQVADTYSNLGNLASFRKDFPKAEALTLKSISLLKTINNKFNVAKSYQILTNIYERKGDYKKALEAEEAFHDEYSKMIDEKKEASLTEFKIIHETEKKEKLLDENKIELLQKNAEVRQRTNLLIVLSLLVFFIIFIGFLIYRQQELKNKQQAQEHELKTAISQIETQHKLQNQRLEISRDLHDNIGAQLTFIISSMDNIRYAFDLKNSKLDGKLKSISNFTKDTIVELRDTIWAMNHSEISFEDLRARILNFIEKAKEAKGHIDFRFSIADDPGVKLTSIQGMNIYRTIQEALNNALKYAKASEITIEIKCETENIVIHMSDNGSGFDESDVELGNGILNMKKRMDDIGAQFSIKSTLGEGTKIHVEFSKTIT